MATARPSASLSAPTCAWASALRAPRSLKLPVRCKLSSLQKISIPVISPSGLATVSAAATARSSARRDKRVRVPAAADRAALADSRAAAVDLAARSAGPAGAVAGGAILGVGLSYVGGYIGGGRGANLEAMAALGLLVIVLMLRPGGLFSGARTRQV